VARGAAAPPCPVPPAAVVRLAARLAHSPWLHALLPDLPNAAFAYYKREQTQKAGRDTAPHGPCRGDYWSAPGRYRPRAAVVGSCHTGETGRARCLAEADNMLWQRSYGQEVRSLTGAQ